MHKDEEEEEVLHPCPLFHLLIFHRVGGQSMVLSGSCMFAS